MAMFIQPKTGWQQAPVEWNIGQKVPKIETEVVTFQATGKELALILEAMKTNNKGAMLALESLTPGGSEFVNDVEACVKNIRETRSNLMEQLVKVTKEKKYIQEHREEILQGIRDGAIQLP